MGDEGLEPPTLSVQSKVVSERLGHASVAITLDIYSHVVPGLQASVAVEHERFLSQCRHAAAKAAGVGKRTPRRRGRPR